MEGIVGDRAADVTVVRDWLRGSDLEPILDELRQTEEVLDSAQRRLQNCRKRIARIMVAQTPYP